MLGAEEERGLDAEPREDVTDVVDPAIDAGRVSEDAEARASEPAGQGGEAWEPIEANEHGAPLPR